MEDKDYGLVSIIVPVYKAEQYIHRCIDSVLHQSYKNIEVILIDDGTPLPDKSAQICDEYAKKDNRIKVIHQENKGVSVARNVGLDNCSGQYVYFLDSDDFIDKNTIQDNIEILYKQDADIVCFNRYDILSRNVLVSRINYIDDMSTYDIVKGIYLSKLPGNCTDKIFKSFLLEKLRFPVALKSAEDIYMMTSLLKEAKKIVANSKCYYYYDRTNNKSITHSQKIDTYWYDFYAVNFRANIAKDKWYELYNVALKDCFKYALKCYQYNLFHDYLNKEQKKYLKSFFAQNKKKLKIANFQEQIMLWDYYYLGLINLFKGLEYFFKAFKKGLK